MNFEHLHSIIELARISIPDNIELQINVEPSPALMYDFYGFPENLDIEPLRKVKVKVSTKS